MSWFTKFVMNNSSNMRLSLLITALCLFFLSDSLAANYRLNTNHINSIFDSALDITDRLFQIPAELPNYYVEVESDQKPSYLIAAALAIGEVALPSVVYAVWFMATLFTGGIGIILLPAAVIVSSVLSNPYHRYYLGTGNNNFRVSLLYCITVNGFGLLNIADAIFLFAAKSDDATYIENGDFIMWKDAAKSF
ncbi:MAG: hypothetical protein KC456_03210 [Flavobacteriales bacterium]|nr:hypothetical protein [Flavobacteriales bacterium]